MEILINFWLILSNFINCGTIINSSNGFDLKKIILNVSITHQNITKLKLILREFQENFQNLFSQYHVVFSLLSNLN